MFAELRKVFGVALVSGQLVSRGLGGMAFAALAVLEPLVRFVLISLAALGIFVTIVFGVLLEMERFPHWFMLGFSGGCFLILGIYYLAMRVVGNVAARQSNI